MAVFGGIVFILVWLAASAVWTLMAVMGGLMANDSGAVASDRHAMLLTVMLVGVAAAGLAGVAGGLAFFWHDMRRALVIAFVALLVGGVGMQAYAYKAFTSAAQGQKR
ncbi:MAG: hypothetical protein U1E19_13475 [Rhodoblastus sp.]